MGNMPPLEFRKATLESGAAGNKSNLLNFFITNFICIAGMLIAATGLHQVSAVELIAIPITLLYANLVEYLLHKGPLHHRSKLISRLFEDHTLLHHSAYTDKVMSFDGLREFRMILLAPAAIIILVLFFILPAGVLLDFLFSRNTALFFIMTALFYILNYEWFHLLAHIKEDSFIGRLLPVRKLRDHHRVHHNPRLMTRYNFNITYPVFDRIFGTLHTPEKKQKQESGNNGKAAEKALNAGGKKTWPD